MIIQRLHPCADLFNGTNEDYWWPMTNGTDLATEFDTPKLAGADGIIVWGARDTQTLKCTHQDDLITHARARIRKARRVHGMPAHAGAGKDASSHARCSNMAKYFPSKLGPKLASLMNPVPRAPVVLQLE